MEDFNGNYRTYSITCSVEGENKPRNWGISAENLEGALTGLRISLMREDVILFPTERDDATLKTVTKISVIKTPGKKIPKRAYN